jgi:adenine-specific DNA-methyltransferase
MNFDQTDNFATDASTYSDMKGRSVTMTLDTENLIVSSFPKTRYYGSKRRLLGWIYDALKDIPFNTVLDAFGGTASVSLLFKMMGKEVTFHDALLSNTISAYALLAEEFPISDLDEFYSFIDGVTPCDGFISRTFSGMYYTDEENRWLDGAAMAIHGLSSPEKKSVYLYCLFQACLKKRPFNLFHRANLNLRTNRDVARSFGNLVTWNTPFSELMKDAVRDVLGAARTSLQTSLVLEPGDIGRLSAGYDLVYLDPPYVNTKNRGESYLKRYHFLEGLSNYDSWGNQIDPSSSIKSLWPRSYMDEWEEKAVFRDRLFDLIRFHRESTVVLSYVAEAFPSEEEIENHFRENFHSVRIFKKDFSHALAKNKKVELLFIGSNA